MQTDQKIWVLGHLINPYRTSGDYNLVVGESPVGAQGPPPHRHSQFSEVFLMLEGQAAFLIDGKEIILSAGECIDIPKGTLHTFRNMGNKACRWVNIHSPKGFQSFFEAFGVSEKEVDAQEKSLDPERISKVIREAPHYDMELQLPV